MAERKSEWPEAGDLVTATAEPVTYHGAYAKLYEFDKHGLLHASQDIVTAVSKAGGECTFRRGK
jgi:hypothetical protein